MLTSAWIVATTVKCVPSLVVKYRVLNANRGQWIPLKVINWKLEHANPVHPNVRHVPGIPLHLPPSAM